MFTVEAGAAVATISELRTHAKQTFEASREQPVVVLVDGQPVGAVVSMEMFALIQEARENRRLASRGAARLDRVRSGTDALMPHDEFWAAAKSRVEGQPR